MSKWRDQFWDYAVENDARREMGDIRICTEVPDHVREAAELALDGPNKKLKTMRSLSDHQAQNNTIASSSRRQSDGVENRVNSVERKATGVQGSGHVAEQWRSPVNEDFVQPFDRDTIAEGCRNDGEQIVGQIQPGFMGVYATENEAVNMNGDFNMDADLTWFNANDEAYNQTIASSSRVRNDGVQILVKDVEREGRDQRSAQVAEGCRSSTSAGVALMQLVNMDVSAVGNDGVNCNEDLNMPEDWLPPVPNDRLAPDHQISAIKDTKRMITDQPVTQPLEIDQNAISEDGGNSVENMNRRMASQFDGAVMDVDRENDVGTTAMASAASTSFSSSSTSLYSFDVFLSFRGEDTRKSFTDHLHKALVNAGIRTFLDDDSIPRGENIESVIRRGMKSSKVAVIVFSKDFPSSRWCLDEVAQVMDCTFSRGLVVIPVFYHVDPSDVRKQSGGYGKVFSAHEKKFERERVQKWRKALERVANMAGMVLGDRHESKFIEDIVKEVGSRVTTPDKPEPGAHKKTSGVALLTTNLIGERFEENIQKIWVCLMKADVFTICIYGMGGIGKTSLVTHIHSQLLEIPNPFHQVYWVTVSQDFSIHRLQILVAKAAKIDLLDEDDQRKRAAKLYEGLTEKQDSVLILDDLWESFDLKEVGIPVGEHRCKLILTSRSLQVCRQMNSGEDESNIIKVVPLSTNEARDLFWETRGSGAALHPEITQVAEGIVKECAGLPLALKTMAGTMKGVGDICEWRNAFEALKESEAVEGDMENKVFRILRFSYNQLSSKLQACFLCCALFPEDHCILRIVLIEHLIGEGIIKGRRSMKAEHNGGHDLLNKLEYACLLEGSGSGEERYVKMHDLLRDMAVQILRADSKAMVEAGKQLKELPDMENWKENLVTVSLMKNNITEIPSGHSPNCPNLSTLLLCLNLGLQLIAESFFEKLNGLRILDLSYTSIRKLPDSVSELVNLTSLLLRSCRELRHVPSLAKLKALKKLDLRETDIEEIPHGMEFLSNLRYLDLYGTWRINQFPTGILPRLSKLQHLDLGVQNGVKAREVASLKELEFVRCGFSDSHDWNTYIQSLERLCKYSFRLQPEDGSLIDLSDMRCGLICLQKELLGYAVGLQGLDIINQVGFVALPKDVQRLLISKCPELKSLYSSFALHHATQLKRLSIWGCDGMEWLHNNLPGRLEVLNIWYLKNLCSLLSEEGGVAQLQPPFFPIDNDSTINNVIFSNLKWFSIAVCPRIKKLFPPHLLPNLRNLEALIVDECENMVEIIGHSPESSVCSTPTPTPTPVVFALPNLKVLNLRKLPELRRICSGGGKLICRSPQEITIQYCPKLKRMPVSLPFVELNGQLSPPSSLQQIEIWPSEWWDSVDWGHPNEKAALLPLVKFSERRPHSFLRLR